MTNLYLIRNCGCDDETCGLVRMNDEQFEFFKTTIENLNSNSTYGCMPRIHVYKIDESMLQEAVDDDYPEHVMPLDGRKYVFTDRMVIYCGEIKEVIGNER